MRLKTLPELPEEVRNNPGFVREIDLHNVEFKMFEYVPKGRVFILSKVRGMARVQEIVP